MTRSELADLRSNIEDFYYHEADLIDLRKFEEWLDLFSDDVIYRMPLVRNLALSQISAEYLVDPLDVSWFDEDKEVLTTRIKQIRTGVHWAEEPLSRTTHFVSNVRIVDVKSTAGDSEELTTRCKFMVYRNRNETEEDKVFGTREDILRPHGDSWQIAKRTLFINQTVLLSNSLSFII
jgi:3-phenylpropionate/cinnamic acid dioxygenase small subunit